LLRKVRSCDAKGKLRRPRGSHKQGGATAPAGAGAVRFSIRPQIPKF